MPMSLPDHVRLMARNNAWANARLHAACIRLTPEEFAAPRTGFFPSLRRTLNHILVVDRAYLADLKGPGRGLPGNPIPYPDAVDLAAAQAEIDRELVGFCDGLDDSGLDRVVTIDRRDGATHRDPVAAILSHLFQHQIHHRGQAHAMLSATRVPPPQLDEFFLASDAPRREAELRRLGLDAR